MQYFFILYFHHWSEFKTAMHNQPFKCFYIHYDQPNVQFLRLEKAILSSALDFDSRHKIEGLFFL